MEVHQDFSEFLRLLNENKVDYVVIGAYALAFHGVPRYTGDLDIYVNPSPENAARIMKALEEFGFSSLGLKAGDFESGDNVIQLGISPVRIDILTSLSGVEWDDVIGGSEEGKYGDVPIRFIGKKELIRNKRSLGRMKDLADIESINPEKQNGKGQ